MKKKSSFFSCFPSDGLFHIISCNEYSPEIICGITEQIPWKATMIIHYVNYHNLTIIWPIFLKVYTSISSGYNQMLEVKRHCTMGMYKTILEMFTNHSPPTSVNASNITHNITYEFSHGALHLFSKFSDTAKYFYGNTYGDTCMWHTSLY